MEYLLLDKQLTGLHGNVFKHAHCAAHADEEITFDDSIFRTKTASPSIWPIRKLGLAVRMTSEAMSRTSQRDFSRLRHSSASCCNLSLSLSLLPSPRALLCSSFSPAQAVITLSVFYRFYRELEIEAKRRRREDGERKDLILSRCVLPINGRPT